MEVSTHSYSVKSLVIFTNEELDYLCKLSSEHYDSKCRAASAGPEFSANEGWLSITRRVRRDFDGDRWLNQDQLQTVCKILETATVAECPDQLFLRSMQIQHDNNQRATILNAHPDPVDAMLPLNSIS